MTPLRSLVPERAVQQLLQGGALQQVGAPHDAIHAELGVVHRAGQLVARHARLGPHEEVAMVARGFERARVVQRVPHGLEAAWKWEDDIYKVAAFVKARQMGQTEEEAAALFEMYGIETGIRLDKLTDLRKLGEEVTGIHVAGNHAVTGDKYFVWSGNNGVAMEGLVDPLIHWCVDASVFGNKGGWLIDQTSGVWSITEKMSELGIPVEKAEVEAILKAVQAELLKVKRTLTDDELRGIAMRLKAGAAAA